MQYPTTRKLESIFYNSINDPQISEDQKKVEQQISHFVTTRQNNTSFQTDPQQLKLALDEFEAIRAGDISKAEAYFRFKSAQNMEDNQIKAKLNIINNRKKQLISQLQFFELAIAKITSEYQGQMLQAKILQPYKHYLEQIFQSAKYNLSEKEENILLHLNKTSYENWVNMIEQFFSKEEVITHTDSHHTERKNFQELFSLLENNNPDIRDESAQHINDIISKHLDSCEQEINSVLEYKKQIDQIRKYPQVDTARHLADDIESQTVHTLIHTVQQHFSTAQRLYKLKAQLLHKDKLAYHERNIHIWEITTQYSYEQAISYVQEAFYKLDPEFEKIFKDFLTQWRIDVFPHKWKMWWAFNYPFCHKYPSLIMLNYSNTISDIKTLAHEVGHGIHSELSQQNQNSLQYRYGMAVAEVASTFMEDFALEEIIRNASEEEQLTLLIDSISTDISTIHRQSACYLFELDIHKEYRKTWYLSHKDIWTLFQKNMQAYMWDYVNQDPWSQNRRSYRSHIRNFFYVYSYASGLLISKALQSKVKQNPQFIQTIKKDFLSVWSSQSPKEIFKNMGIDINDQTFWKQWLQEIENKLQKAEKLAQKLWKIAIK